MSGRNDAAPHECPQCGEPGYIGFGIPAKCIQKGCIFYDAGLWCEWAMLIPDDGDPPPALDLDWDGDTPAYGTFRPLLTTYRDICTGCGTSQDFQRSHSTTIMGGSFAFCPSCGIANVWS